MKKERRNCQNCQKDFLIDPDDFGFYEKIKVPPPTFCPDCRLQRRLMRRNERFLYSRTCSGSDKKIVSVYDENVSFPVYSRDYWYSDAWDGTSYGRDYDFSKTFFEQLIDLAKVAPRMYMWNVNTTSSDYSNYIVDSKNCYLCFTALGNNEDCMYCGYLNGSINCLDSIHITKCEKCYQCFNCENCYNCKYSTDSANCRDSYFLADCNDCSDCFGCVGLRNKQYCIWNKQYKKEDYLKELEVLSKPSRQNIDHLYKKLNDLWLEFPHRYMHGKKNQNVTGDYVINSNNCKNSFFIQNSEDSKNLFYTFGLKTSMDVIISSLNNELLYECHAIPKQNQNIKFSDLCSNGSDDVEYSSNCDGCTHIFGCIGLRKKEYCILNKQYSKDQYNELVPKIKEHMDKMPYTTKGGHVYRYGEFFPPELSPYAYNESVAHEHFPLNKVSVENKGLDWKELREKNYKATISPLMLPDDPNQFNGDITREVIGCMNEGKGDHNCTLAFRILPDELQFYKQFKLPLPVYCPNCRHHQRLKQRNPLKLWQRTCMCDKTHAHHSSKCEIKIETSYALERPEIIYCEKCYQQEVY